MTQEATTFPLTIERSPTDFRDWDVKDFLITKQNKMCNFTCKDLKEVRNQGQQGTCAAQVAACMKEWQEKNDYGFSDYMSPQFIYDNRFNIDAPGMHSRDVMRILRNIGIVTEKEYEYKSKREITEDLLQSASRHKIKGYAQVRTISDLKKSLHENGPCLIAFPVFNQSMKMWENNGRKRLGGHAMTVVGYSETSFVIRNSWGKEWGDNGYCYYPFSDWGSHWEIWTTVDAKGTKIEEVEEEVEDTMITCPSCILS